MTIIHEVSYTQPSKTEKPNPYIESLRPFADQGVDAAFAVETAKPAVDKILIQKALNAHGFSARAVDVLKAADTETVTITFLVRPLRKRKGDTEPG